MSENNMNTTKKTGAKLKNKYFKIFFLPVTAILYLLFCVQITPSPYRIDSINIIFVSSIIIELFMGLSETNNIKKLYYFIACTVMSLVIDVINARYFFYMRYEHIFYYNVLWIVFFCLTVVSLVAAIIIIFRINAWSQSQWDDKKDNDQNKSLKLMFKKNECKAQIKKNKYERKAFKAEYEKIIKTERYVKKIEKIISSSSHEFFSLKKIANILCKFPKFTYKTAYVVLALSAMFIFLRLPYIDNVDTGNSWFDKVCRMVTHMTGFELLKRHVYLAFIIYIFLFFLALILIVLVLYFVKTMSNDVSKTAHDLKNVKRFIFYTLFISAIFGFISIPYMNSSSSSASGWFGKVSALVSSIIGIEKLSQINPISFIIYLLMYITAIGFICLALLFFTAATDKLIENGDDLKEGLKKHINLDNICKLTKYIFVILAIVMFFVIPHYDGLIDIISNWLEKVKGLTEKIGESGFKVENNQQALMLYIFIFTVLVIMVASVLTISKKIIFNKRKRVNNDYNKNIIAGYEAPIAILVVFTAVLMSFSHGMPEFDGLTDNWKVLLMIIMYILLIMIAIEIVRIMLEQCTRENSLLKRAINLVFILILDFVIGLTVGVFYKLRASDIVADICSLIFKDNENLIGKEVKNVIEKMLLKEIAVIEETQDNRISDIEMPIDFNNMTLWRRDNEHE